MATFIVVLGLAALGACSKDNTGANGGGNAGACLEGKWSLSEGGTVRSFTFRGDHSGEEVYTKDDVRPLTWSVKDASTVHLVYKAHGDTLQSEADLGYSCATNTVGPGYKK